MKSWKFKGLNDQWSDYLLCLFFHMGIPLLPLLMERLFTGKVMDSSLAITTAIYSISIGLSSKNKAMFGFCFFIGILFSAIYGLTVVTTTQISQSINVGNFSIIALSSVFIFHAAERYNRHVGDCKPFLLFSNEGEGS